MSWFVCDVEADGPCPGLYSMSEFGVVKLDRDLKTTFYAQTAPLKGADFDLAAMKVTGLTREKHLTYPHPEQGHARL